jgi:hypothetical protein
MKNNEHTYKFYLNTFFFNRPFEYGDGGIFRLLRWMQNLHHTTSDHKILYADRCLEDEQVLIRTLLRESKKIGES